jgi:hypothetical protein
MTSGIHSPTRDSPEDHMIVLGLLLIAVSTAFGIELFVSNNNTEVVGEVFGQEITHLSAGGYYLLGSASTVALFFGLLLIDSGLRRTRGRKAEREEFEARQAEAARQAQWEKSAAVSEAERLREELVEERMNQVTLGGVVPPPDLAADEAAPGDGAPVDDPEHSESDHRGLLGRLRHDRNELPEPPPATVAAPAAAPAKAATPAPSIGGGPSVPRPDAATDAFNAALAPAVERDRPRAE